LKVEQPARHSACIPNLIRGFSDGWLKVERCPEIIGMRAKVQLLSRSRLPVRRLKLDAVPACPP